MRDCDRAPTSQPYQGQRQKAATKVRMYGCNRFLTAVTRGKLGKPGASVYGNPANYLPFGTARPLPDVEHDHAFARNPADYEG